MKQFLLIVLVLTCLSCYGQTLNSLSLKRTFNNEEEFLKANPETRRSEILVDSKSIKILNSGTSTKEINRDKIGSNLNSFVFSPSRENFVAYEETEVDTKDLFFYRGDGTLLAKKRVSIYPRVKFSANGEYVIAFNGFGREIFVFTKTGDLIFSGDYIEMINDKSKILYNVLISENCSEIVINAGEDTYLFSLRERKQIFKTNTGRLLDGCFYSSKNQIALRTFSSINKVYDIKIISKTNGFLSDEIVRVSKADFLSNRLVVSKDSKVLEYVFK